jgi:hypothetical protein
VITLIVVLAALLTVIAGLLLLRRRAQLDNEHARRLAQLAQRPGDDDQFGTWPRVRVPWTDRSEGEA